MHSPATIAALQRLIAILLALIDALAAPVEGAPRPLATRLAIRAFSASLKRLAAHLAAAANDAASDPAPTPQPPERAPIRTPGRRTPQTIRGSAVSARSPVPENLPAPRVKTGRPTPLPSHA